MKEERTNRVKSEFESSQDRILGPSSSRGKEGRRGGKARATRKKVHKRVWVVHVHGTCDGRVRRRATPLHYIVNGPALRWNACDADRKKGATCSSSSSGGGGETSTTTLGPPLPVCLFFIIRLGYQQPCTLENYESYYLGFDLADFSQGHQQLSERAHKHFGFHCLWL